MTPMSVAMIDAYTEVRRVLLRRGRGAFHTAFVQRLIVELRSSSAKIVYVIEFDGEEVFGFPVGTTVVDAFYAYEELSTAFLYELRWAL